MLEHLGFIARFDTAVISEHNGRRDNDGDAIFFRTDLFEGELSESCDLGDLGIAVFGGHCCGWKYGLAVGSEGAPMPLAGTNSMFTVAS